MLDDAAGEAIAFSSGDGGTSGRGCTTQEGAHPMPPLLAFLQYIQPDGCLPRICSSLPADTCTIFGPIGSKLVVAIDISASKETSALEFVEAVDDASSSRAALFSVTYVVLLSRSARAAATSCMSMRGEVTAPPAV